MQVTVSIGRNYGHNAKSPVRGRPWHGRPMSAAEWRRYRRDLFGIMLMPSGATFAFANDGVSCWQDDDGIVWEQSYTLGVTGISAADHAGIRRQLAALRERFQQDSIAVTVADPSFI